MKRIPDVGLGYRLRLMRLMTLHIFISSNYEPIKTTLCAYSIFPNFDFFVREQVHRATLLSLFCQSASSHFHVIHNISLHEASQASAYIGWFDIIIYLFLLPSSGPHNLRIPLFSSPAPKSCHNPHITQLAFVCIKIIKYLLPTLSLSVQYSQ